MLENTIGLELDENNGIPRIFWTLYITLSCELVMAGHHQGAWDEFWTVENKTKQ